MKLSTFESYLHHCVSIDPRQWACALLLGEARRRSNKARAQTSDRGDDGNQAVDLHGALGELLLYQIARKCKDPEALEYMRNQVYQPEGGRDVEGPDLLFKDGAKSFGIDVKTFDCSPKKKFFAINERKHQQLRGKCFGYVGLICPAFAARACLTGLIPYEDVSKWRCWQLRVGTSGSLSRNCEIDPVMERYAPEYSFKDNCLAVFDRKEILAIARETGQSTMASWLASEFPSIRTAVEDVRASL